ncbi:unnamed protein product [Lasius platythorax]|uniref:Uncharacterized protein n=1 Tax=Lasius platythorax TaxID=488582 RepID=A0AAV2N1F6_9HYME
MILTKPVPKSPCRTIHQDVYAPPSTLVSFATPFPDFFLPKSSVLHVSSQDNWERGKFGRVSLERTIRLGSSVFSGRVSMWGRAGGSTRLNMCTLLSLRRNNTRYLARDKCLNRKIPESTGAAAKLRISLAAGVSPHKGLPGCPFFPPAWLSGARRVALCHSFYGRRERATE